MARALRNRFIAQWAGREWALRQQPQALRDTARTARLAGDIDHASVLIGQDAGLIDFILPAGEVVQRMVAQAEELIVGHLRQVVR
jgi:nitronate monooxygenase